MEALLKRGLLVFSIPFLALFLFMGAFPTDEMTDALRIILAIYLFLVFARTVFFFYSSFQEKVRDYLLDKRNQAGFARPFVSILVPCFNEETVIMTALDNLVHLDYPFYEVIVINDGSTDSTQALAEMVAMSAQKCRVTVVNQSNSGKATALNNGLLNAAGSLILCVDADSRLEPGSLEAATRHFADPEVGAVAGFIEVGNQKSMLGKLQELEYLVGLNFTRRAMSLFGIVPIVPGPAGMFRRQAIYEAGGLLTDRNLFAEDAELSLRIIAAGWKVKSEEDLVAITEAPDSIQTLLRQRYRWNRGTFQAMLRNMKSLMFGSGWRGRAVISYIFTESVLTPFFNFGLILYFITYYMRTGEVQLFTKWYLYLLVVDALTTFLVTHKHGNFAKWLFITVVNKLFFYYMLLTWRILSLYDEWRDQKMTWDKLDRIGSI